MRTLDQVSDSEMLPLSVHPLGCALPDAVAVDVSPVALGVADPDRPRRRERGKDVRKEIVELGAARREHDRDAVGVPIDTVDDGDTLGQRIEQRPLLRCGRAEQQAAVRLDLEALGDGA